MIVADPPWQFGDKLPGASRGAEKNYKVMTVDEICAMCDGKNITMCGQSFPLAANSVLFLWRVSSQVEEAYRVVRAWGFVPKSEIVWIKTTKPAPPPKEEFDGDFSNSHEALGGDDAPLNSQDLEDFKKGVRDVYALMRDGKWHTADEIRRLLGQSEGLRRMRELRRWFEIEKVRQSEDSRLWSYRLGEFLGHDRVDEKNVTQAKLHFGMGHYVRASHETCIIATRGKATSLIKNHSTRSVFFAPYTKHSEKPQEFYTLVENLCEGPRLELFARRHREGWICIGDELQSPEAAQ
jgi:N6-adenosine-specific RNA methylase IME4